MASNHTQYNRNRHDGEELNDLSSANQPTSSVSKNGDISTGAADHSNMRMRADIIDLKGGEQSLTSPLFDQFDLSKAKNNGPSVINDTVVLRQRRTGLYNNGSKLLDMAEDKIANNKMDLLHWSVPSSLKSTFMMAFSPNGQRVASTHGDHRIYICDLNTGQHLETLEGHPKTPWCFAWHPTNKDIFASGCLSGEVRVWDLRSKESELWVSENNTIITSISFHPRERILAIATANAIHFWDWAENVPFAITTTPFEKERVKYIEFDSSGTKLITGITNCTAIAAYTRDSLQNRIIDSCLNNGNLQQTQPDNMTQNSEISSHQHNHNNIHQLNSTTLSLNDRNRLVTTRATSLPKEKNNSNVKSSNLTSTITSTLSRIASLYKNLESLEDSIRSTSFPTFNSTHQRQNIEQSNVSNDNINLSNYRYNNDARSNESAQTRQDNDLIATESPTINNSDETINQQDVKKTKKHASRKRSHVQRNSIRSPNAYEPLVVSFDELLENIQLSPIIVRGRTLDINSVLARNPIDLSNHLDYVVQFESINQVNQNFIRISKLMSSVRLYRQIIQQIVSSDSGKGHYQPNQFLTAPSNSHNGHVNAAHIPIVLRYGGLPGAIDDQNHISDRPIDPILAIQFRNCARNVPLGSLCKVDLLSARSMCMVKSQQYLECSIAPNESPINNSTGNNLNETLAKILDTENVKLKREEESDNINLDNDQIRIIQPFFSLLEHLHRVLLNINQTPLTTSNVHTQIASLRNLLDKLLSKFYDMIQAQEEAGRLINLIHEISQNLTGRSWTAPLGRTFDELRLDVIHTFCIVDLTLHLSRQVQLLQMQRISAIARIKDRRSNTTTPIQNKVHIMCPPSTSTTRSSNQDTNNQQPSTSVNLINEPKISSSTNPIPSCSSSSHTANQEEKDFLQQPRNNSINYDSPPKQNTNNVTEHPPGKRRNNDKSSPSHLVHKKVKFEPTEMIDCSQQPQVNNPVTNDGLVYTSLRNASCNHNNNFFNSSRTQDVTTKSQAPNLRRIHSAMEADGYSSNDNNLGSNDTVPERPNFPGSDQRPPAPVVSMEASPNLQRVYYATTTNNNLQIFMRFTQRVNGSNPVVTGGAPAAPEEINLNRAFNSIPAPHIEVRRRALSHDNSSFITSPISNEGMARPVLGEQVLSEYQNMYGSRARLVSGGHLSGPNHLDIWPRHQFHIIIPNHIIPNHARSPNVLYMTLPSASSNYRLQCWNFRPSSIPNIKDAISNLITNRCRIDSNSSIDISKNGNFVACLVPLEDPGHPTASRYELRVISLKASDFGSCYYVLPHDTYKEIPVSVSLSPSARYVVVGLSHGRQYLSGLNSDDPDGLSIAKVFKLNERQSFKHVRDIKIKRQGSMNLNAIKWMPRGIVYNVGQHPIYQHRYHTRRLNHA